MDEGDPSFEATITRLDECLINIYKFKTRNYARKQAWLHNAHVYDKVHAISYPPFLSLFHTMYILMQIFGIADSVSFTKFLSTVLYDDDFINELRSATIDILRYYFGELENTSFSRQETDTLLLKFMYNIVKIM